MHAPHAADADGDGEAAQAWLDAEPDAEAPQNRRDSLRVPEMPTMDMSEFEALEAEAEKKARRSRSLTPSQQAAPSPHTAAQSARPAGTSASVVPTLSLQNIPDASVEASRTPTGDLPQLQMCMSPSLDGPTVCASPQVPGGPKNRASEAAPQGSLVSPVAPSHPGAGRSVNQIDNRDADAKARAVKNALVNQSLTGEPPACIPAWIASCARQAFAFLLMPQGHKRSVALPTAVYIGSISLQGFHIHLLLSSAYIQWNL